MSLKGFISYAYRDAETIYESIKVKLLAYTNNLVNIDDNKLLSLLIKVWSNIAEHIHYYIDAMYGEVLISTVSVYENAIRLARSNGAVINTYKAATTTIRVTLTYTGDSDTPLLTSTTIPAYSRFSNGNVVFTNTVTTVIPQQNASSVYVDLLCSNISIVNGIALGDLTGELNKVILLPYSIHRNTVSIYVDNEAWTRVDSFAFSSPTDKHYIITVEPSGGIITIFGDNVMGAAPIGNCTANIATTDGELGNVPANTVTEILSDLIIPIEWEVSAYNIVNGSGGGGIDTLEDIRRNLIYLNRNNKVMIRPIDFTETASLHPSVAFAGISFNGGLDVTVYIYPLGGGIASSLLIQDVATYLEERKSIPTVLSVKPIGETSLFATIDVTVLPTYSNSEVKSKVIADLLSYINSISGIEDSLYISNIYSEIEAVEGVSHSTIKFVETLPYPLQTVGNTKTLLYSAVYKVVSNIGILNKTITVRFVSSTTYTVIEDGSSLGTFTVGDVETLLGSTILEQITVTDNGYSSGDEYELDLYSSNNSVISDISLGRYSVPKIYDTANLTINTTGGY